MKDARYLAFWSDTAHGDEPVSLFEPHAGDQVALRLTLSYHRWTVYIADGRVHRRIVTAQEGTARFQQALWYDEDLAYNHPKFVVYPRLMGLRLSELSVNGHAPEAQDLQPSWMLVGKTVVEPSELDKDSFTLRPARSTVPAVVARLLERLGPSYSQMWKPLAEMADATEHTPRAKLLAWRSDMRKALTIFETKLRQQRWSVKTKRITAVLDGTLDSWRELARDAPSTSGLSAWQARWSAQTISTQIAVARFLHALQLPWPL